MAENRIRNSPVGRHRVYQRTSRFRRHLPGAKAYRGRRSGGDPPANWPILGRPADLHSAGHAGNPEIRTSGRGRVYSLSELRFSASPSAAFLGVPAKRRSRVSGTLDEPPGLRFYGAICSRVGRRRVDRRVCDFPRCRISDFRRQPVIKGYAVAAPRLRCSRRRVCVRVSARKESETRVLASWPEPRIRQRSVRKFPEVGPTSGIAIPSGTSRKSRFRNSGDAARRAAC